ncbi:MAG: hypothetical protein NZ805_02495 [Armatimonadetes bacterium]|nr:hypothetical protein [Armatimonadota bacterium]MDW8028162.1 hypothetical protein [Armatimonadota bacterium]
MKAQGFVYAGDLSAGDLQSLIEKLGGDFVHFTWTLKLFFAGEGVPKTWGDEGSAFNKNCEVKWQRVEGEKFHVLLLCDSPMGDLPLSQIEGCWETEEQVTELISLDDKRFAPSFERYPAVGSAKARLRCKVFYRDGFAMFVSPREVIADARAESA